MDVEKTIEFILAQQARTEAALASLADKQARTEGAMEGLGEENKKTDALLRRAVRWGIQEARRQRARSRRLEESAARVDESITRLAAAQLVTEEKLQGFIESMRRGGNGHQ